MKAVILDTAFTRSCKAQDEVHLLDLYGISLRDLLVKKLKAFDLEGVQWADWTPEQGPCILISAGFLPEIVPSSDEAGGLAVCFDRFLKSAASFYLSLDRPGVVYAIKINETRASQLARFLSREGGGKQVTMEEVATLFSAEWSPALQEIEEENDTILFSEEAAIHSEEVAWSYDFYMDGFSDVSEYYQIISVEKAYALMDAGVRIDDPTLVRIAPEVEVGAGSWIQGRVEITGSSVIGKKCLITDGSVIRSSSIGNGVSIRSSVIEESVMEDESNIGPFSHLRPQSHLGEGVHIGNFVEVKKASLGVGTKAGHLAYIGDAEVGDDVNISCGVIFCNYDGKHKHQAKVGDHAFLGSNANLVAPVEVGKEGFVAAGSTITAPVAEGSLAIERAERKDVAGYVAKKKREGKL